MNSCCKLNLLLVYFIMSILFLTRKFPRTSGFSLVAPGSPTKWTGNWSFCCWCGVKLIFVSLFFMMCYAGKILIGKVEPISYIQQCPWNGDWVRCDLHRWCEPSSVLWASPEAGCAIMRAERSWDLIHLNLWVGLCGENSLVL